MLLQTKVNLLNAEYFFDMAEGNAAKIWMDLEEEYTKDLFESSYYVIERGCNGWQFNVAERKFGEINLEFIGTVSV